MGYQALLFCPDEKTARTVTQVLSELDFAVTPCTEPFAAVKKLMAEHYDAVVVDCDNEQNATLLFKSARNTANNQAALAVAVVEGQAGVAKAFRIGANLVLTKPINVEQAKGTLRVARGLLRKSEGAKPAGSVAKPVAAAPVPPAPAPVKPAAPVSPPASTVQPAAAPKPSSMPPVPAMPFQRVTPPPAMTGSASTEVDDDELLEVTDEPPAPVMQKPAPPAKISTLAAAQFAADQKAGRAADAPAVPASRPASTGAASAPAPARDPKPVTESKPLVIPQAVPVVENAAVENEPVASAPAPAFTFGGHIASDEAAPKSGSKKPLIAVAAIVVLAAAAYAGWMQFGKSHETSSAPAHVSPAPVTPASATIPASTTTSPATTSAPSASSSSVPDTTTKTVSSKQPETSTKNKPSLTETKPAVDEAPSKSVEKITAVKAPPAPIVITNHSAPEPTHAAADPSAPSLTALTAGTSAPMPNLMGKTAAPAPKLQTMNISQGVSRGLLIKEVPPVYPQTALLMHAEGAVEMTATISRNGDITAVKVLSGDSRLAHAAVDAVKQWKYKPYLLNGEPVEIQTPITVKFKLPR